MGTRVRLQTLQRSHTCSVPLLQVLIKNKQIVISVYSSLILIIGSSIIYHLVGSFLAWIWAVYLRALVLFDQLGPIGTLGQSRTVLFFYHPQREINKWAVITDCLPELPLFVFNLYLQFFRVEDILRRRKGMNRHRTVRLIMVILLLEAVYLSLRPHEIHKALLSSADDLLDSSLI